MWFTYGLVEAKLAFMSVHENAKVHGYYSLMESHHHELPVKLHDEVMLQLTKIPVASCKNYFHFKHLSRYCGL